MFYYDWTIVLVLPGLLLSLWAQALVKSRYAKYGQMPSHTGLTGAEFARALFAREGIGDVRVERVSGRLTDHYDPRDRTLRLSEGVADSSSVAALGIAAHEAGHALQHRDQYAPLILRTAAVPAANIGSNLAWPLFLAGLVFRWEPLMTAGILLFTLAVAFTAITLPVEFNASRRALAALEAGGYLADDELAGAKKVLSAAALTYVAAALTAVLQLLRLLALANRRRD